MTTIKQENSVCLKCPESLFECQLCMEEFKSPRVLPCQHIFCKTCVLTLMKKSFNTSRLETSDRNFAFMCPVCRRECSYIVSKGQLLEEQISIFPESFLLKSLFEYRTNLVRTTNVKPARKMNNQCNAAVQTTTTTKDKRVQVGRKTYTVGLQNSPMMVNKSVSTNVKSNTLSTQTENETNLRNMLLLCHRLGTDIKSKFKSTREFLWKCIRITTEKVVSNVLAFLSALRKVALYTLYVFVGIVLILVVVIVALSFYKVSYHQTRNEANDAIFAVIIFAACVLLLLTAPHNNLANQNRVVQDQNHEPRYFPPFNLPVPEGRLRLRGRRGDKHKIPWRPRPPFPL